MHISCKSTQSLYILHQKILLSFNLPDIHFFAFYLQGRPFESFDFEWGGAGAFNNPVESLFRLIHHKIAINPRLSQDSEAQESFISNFMNEVNNSSSDSVNLPPINEAQTKTIGQCLFEINDTFFYVYDFGDLFIFKIEVRDITSIPKLSKGKRNLMFEDGFDPDEFDISNFIHSISIEYGSFATRELDSSSGGPKFLTSKKQKSRKKLIKYQKYEQTIYNLMTDMYSSYPDQFISEIKRTTDNEFTRRLLIEFNSHSGNYSSEFFFKCYFSSNTPYHQLCVLFLNQIQFYNGFSDDFFTSFLEYSGSLYVKNKTEYKNTYKNLLITVLFLCFDIFKPSSIETFLSYSHDILTKQDLDDAIKFWNTSTAELNINSPLIYGAESTDRSNNGTEITQEYKFFTKSYIYSKVSKKALLYQLFNVFPTIINPLVLFILDKTVEFNNNIRDWSLPIIELLGEHADLIDLSSLVDLLVTKAIYGDSVGQSTVAISCWLITDDLSFVRNLKDINSSKIQTKLKNIKKNPVNYKKKILKKRITYWTRIKGLENIFISNNSNNSINDPKSIYVFEVSLTGRKVSRTIAIEGKSALDDLHLSIQDAFNFDNDHLYEFDLKNESSNYNDSYYSPDDENGPYATDKFIYQCNFFIGMKFLYIFDYGDKWKFKLLVKDIRPKLTTEKGFPYIISNQGNSPDQYPDFD